MVDTNGHGRQLTHSVWGSPSALQYLMHLYMSLLYSFYIIHFLYAKYKAAKLT